MSNSSKNQKKPKTKNPTTSNTRYLDEKVLESSDDEETENKPAEDVAALQKFKPKKSIFGKTWNGVKQFFHTAAPKALKSDKSVEESGGSDTTSNLTTTETEVTEESEAVQSDPLHQQTEPSMNVQKNDVSNGCGWNGGEIIDCSKGNPIIMEVAVPFENMPDLLRLRIIGTTINYILNVDSQGYGFITQERIEAHFKEYTGVDLNYACQLVNTTFKDFIDEYFSSQFKNCHPHGVVRGSFVDKPVQNNFDNFGAPAATAAVAPPPTIRAIENASSNQSTEESSAVPVKTDESNSNEQSQSTSSAPVIQEERTNNCQSPFTSSSQSYTTPVESDTELSNVEASANGITDEHDTLSTPDATDAPSTTLVFDIIDEIQNVDDVPDLEEDVLDIVSKAAKEQDKEEEEPETEKGAKEVKTDGKQSFSLAAMSMLESSSSSNDGESSSSDTDVSSDEEETEITVKEAVVKEPKVVEEKKDSDVKQASTKPDDKFLRRNLLLSDDDEEEATPIKKPEPAVKQSIPVKESVVQKPTAVNPVQETKLPTVDKPVNESQPPSEEKIHMLNKKLLEIESEDEEAAENKPPITVKEPVSKPTPPPVVKEVPKPLKSGATLLQRDMLSSDDSSDEAAKTEPPKPVVEEIKKQPTPPKKSGDAKKLVPVKSDAANARLLKNKLIDDSGEDSTDDDTDLKTTSSSNQATGTKSSTSADKSHVLDRGLLDPSSEEENRSSNHIPSLPKNHLEDDTSEDSSEDEVENHYPSGNKKVKSRSIEPVKNLHLLDDRFVRPSDSESESEQFVYNDKPKEEEAKKEEIPSTKSEEAVFNMNDNKELLESDDEVVERTSSGESMGDEYESSDEEGPSSLEVSDEEDNKNRPKQLEEDIMDLLDEQVVKDFSKKSVENDFKAKAEEAKNNEENLQKLAKKKEEYEKQGPSASGVKRLENYFDTIMNDHEPAKIIIQQPSKATTKPAEVKKAKSKSPEKLLLKPTEAKNEKSLEKKPEPSKVVESKKPESPAKAEPEKPKANEVQKQPSKSPAKKESKEAKTSFIGKYDPNIPVAGDEFLDKIICSEEVIVVKKAASVFDQMNNDISPADVNNVPVMDDELLDLLDDDNKQPVELIDDGFLDDIGASDNISKNAVQVAGDEFLDLLEASNVQKSVQVADDSFLDFVETPAKPAVKVSTDPPMVGDDFLDLLDAREKPAVQAKVPVAGDEFLDLLEDSNVQKSVQVADDSFLDLVEPPAKPAIQESMNPPIVGDDFLDMVEAPAKPTVPVAGDEFLELLETSNEKVQVAGDDFLDMLDAPGKPVIQESNPPLVGDDFLDMVEAPAKPAVPVAGDEFLDLLEDSNVQKSVQVADDSFLDLVEPPAKPAIQESTNPPLVGDDFLEMVDAPANAVPVAGDEFLDLLDASNDEKSVPVVDDHFLDLLDAHEKPAVQESIAPMVGDDFLEQIGDSASTMPFKRAESKQSNSLQTAFVPGQQPFKPVVNHKPTNLPSFKAENVAKLIEAAEIGPNYDSDNSETSAPGTSNDTFTPIKYVYDTSYRVPNYDTVHAMKEKIAKSMLPPKLSHLLNFWLENFSGFPELIVFFQYLYYHIERLDRVENLTFKDFHNLIDAIIRREEVFKMISHLVANVPLMCQYKFLIYDNNYPEYIYVNPDLLELQVYPLAPGLPTAVMYLLGSKKKWLLSDLKKEFIDATDKEFYHQLINFCNDRPDLVMLERLRPTSILPEMIIALNDHISLRLCCLMFTLKDLNVAEKLHLRDDYINSMKQFIPQRSS